jgi:HlyD family secretion protein
VVVAALLLAAGYFAWSRYNRPAQSDAVIGLSGRIEADEATVSSKLAGRILELRVREGDEVNAGDVIAVLDDELVRAREEQARAALARAEAGVRASNEQGLVLTEQLRQAQLNVQQARGDTTGRARQAEAELAAAQAVLAQQQAALQLATFDRDAYEKLAKTGAVSDRQARMATSSAEQQAAAVEAAQRRVEAAQGGLATATANLTAPDIREAAVAALRRQLVQQQAEVASAHAQVEQARAQLAEAQANRADLTIEAPFDGAIATRAAEVGEVVGAGTAIVTVVDLRRAYLRGFVTQGQIGRVKVGQAAHVFLDSNPTEPIDAVVARVDPQATFTPENTYFREDRVRQVVGLKLQLKGAFGFAKPGMPAEGEILVLGERWPPAAAR